MSYCKTIDHGTQECAKNKPTAFTTIPHSLTVEIQ